MLDQFRVEGFLVSDSCAMTIEPVLPGMEGAGELHHTATVVLHHLVAAMGADVVHGFRRSIFLAHNDDALAANPEYRVIARLRYIGFDAGNQPAAGPQAIPLPGHESGVVITTWIVNIQSVVDKRLLGFEFVRPGIRVDLPGLYNILPHILVLLSVRLLRWFQIHNRILFEPGPR